MNTFTIQTVWLCDDDPDDHYVFSEAMAKVLPHASLTCYSGGPQLLAALNRQQPDVLFLDINMPEINGLETLRQIRDTAMGKDLPIIMYSVSEQKPDKAAAHELGVVLYLVKPQLFGEIMHQLQTIFACDWSNHDEIGTFFSEKLQGTDGCSEV